MKKLLSYFCSVLIVFSFMNIVLAENDQTPSKVLNVPSINIEVDYVVTNYQKLKFSDDDNLFDNSEKFGGYLGLTLSWVHRIVDPIYMKYGIITLFSKDYKNTFEVEYNKYTIENEQKYYEGFGFLVNVGYKIRFNSVELMPYVGLSYLKQRVVVYQTTDGYDIPSEVRVSKDKVPITTGLNVIFLTSELINFFTGFELGYAISSDDDYLIAYGWGYNKAASESVSKNTDPMTGFMGKIILGISFNYL